MSSMIFPFSTKFVFFIILILQSISIIPIASAYDDSFFSTSLPQPILEYKFENNLQNQIDGREATVIGNITYVNGVHDKSIKLTDGTLIMIPNSNEINFNSGLTISFWSKIPANAINFDDNANMITKGSQFFFRIDPFHESPNRVAFFTGIGGILEPRVWAQYVPNTWQHWTVTWDGSTLKMYKDGLPVMYGITASVQNRTGTLDFDNSELIIGGKGFVGEIDDLQIYAQALSDSDVFTQIYGVSLFEIELIILAIGFIGIVMHHMSAVKPKTLS